jgi:hypothetical protein
MYANIPIMKAVLAVLLAATLLSPSCLCSLHAAPVEDPAHTCCSETKAVPQPEPDKDGCPTGCGHCTQDLQSPQDLPKSVPTLSAQPAGTVDAAPPHPLLFFPGPVLATGLRTPLPAPPGHPPLYLLHCALLC